MTLRGSAPDSLKPNNESSEGSNEDLSRIRRGALVAEEILRAAEQVQITLANGELNAVPFRRQRHDSR
jgi:hypothetical protein